MPLYDHPFYKQLRKNDLGRDANQGGPAIPKALLGYFPPLPKPADKPTEENFVLLDLFDGDLAIGTVTSRWHYQTWGGTRTPEHRLTQHIESALLKTAQVDDILRFERQLDTVDRYRVTLVRGGTREHSRILRANAGRRWGTIGPEGPRTLSGIHQDVDDILRASNEPFSLFADRPFADSHKRLLRDAAFSRLIKRAYDHRCAACGQGFVLPIDDPAHEPPSEPEAAHIVPVSFRGADDLRNGLCLCRAHHWAFDGQIIFVDEASTWRVVTASKKENRNSALNDIDGIRLVPPKPAYPSPDPRALAWHRERVLSTS